MELNEREEQLFSELTGYGGLTDWFNELIETLEEFKREAQAIYKARHKIVEER